MGTVQVIARCLVAVSAAVARSLLVYIDHLLPGNVITCPQQNQSAVNQPAE
jgi:hypothetical protein